LSNPFQLARLEAWKVFVPLVPEWTSSPEYGGDIPDCPSVIIKLEDNEGHCGYGEGLTRLSGDDLRAPLVRLLQEDPARIRPLCLEVHPDGTYWHRPAPPSPFAPELGNLIHRIRHPLQTALETAWLDLLARRAGIPLGALFGGFWRDRVAADYWMDRVTPAHARRCAARARQLGFTGVKLKTTLHDENTARLEAIGEEAGADFHVTVDPNGRFYRLDDALPEILAMDAVGNMRILEDPFPRTHLSDFAALRPRIRARVVVHVDPPESLHSVLVAQAAGGLNISNHTIGLNGWRLAAAAAGAANLPVWLGTNVDLGIATAAQVHLCAATPNCQLPGDLSGPWVRADDLIEETLVVEDGCILVPPGPGHGATFDPDAAAPYVMEHFAVAR